MRKLHLSAAIEFSTGTSEERATAASLGRHPRRSLAPLRGWVLGTLTVGVLDLLDAFVFFGLRGVAPIWILHAIASGLLGPQAREGGAATAGLGVLLHFTIAAGVVGVYFLAGRRLPVLVRRPWICGPLYGLGVYLVMQLVVLPLSAAAVGGIPRAWPVLLNGLLIHALGVGLPSALWARAALRPAEMGAVDAN